MRNAKTPAGTRDAFSAGAVSAESPRRTVDGGNLTAHGPDVGAELAAVMDRVEEDEPEEFPDRHLHDHLAAREELALAIPARVVESRHLAVQLVPVLLEGGGRFLDAGDRRRFPLPAARARELAAGGVLEDEGRQQLTGGRRPLVGLVIELAVRHRADHAEEGVLLRLAPQLEEFTLGHGHPEYQVRGALALTAVAATRPPLKPPRTSPPLRAPALELTKSGGALTHHPRWAFATPPETPLARRRRYAARSVQGGSPRTCRCSRAPLRT